MTTHRAIESIDPDWLRRRPLPMPSEDGDKEARGNVLVIAGSAQMPGAALLSAVAALRAGAGKLTVATAASVAAGLALLLPEARVIPLPETPSGGLALAGIDRIADCASKTQSTLIGPGMQDEDATVAFVRALLPHAAQAPLVLDALAMMVVAPGCGEPLRFDQAVAFTPHAGEMAALCGCEKAQVGDDAVARAVEAAARWRAVVALKGRRTVIASADGTLREHVGGSIGLATSGSGDVLAGLVAGLASRGAALAEACAWAVALHGLAGRRQAQHSGPLGFLARELSAHVPGLMHELSDAPTGDGPA